ncbi:MAG: metallopeptidase family protein [Alphaproteobacteria bacterium]|nr:metallopeptidase family protein [Alphaproteobacteria bacterium]
MYPHQIAHPLDISLDDFERIAFAAYDAMPQELRVMTQGVAIFIRDFAEADVLKMMEIDNPYGLLGLYHGIDLTQKSISWAQTEPDRIFLYRKPILAEWVARGDETIAHMIQHVLIHEIGHHFGLSDDDMHAIEDATD